MKNEGGAGRHRPTALLVLPVLVALGVLSAGRNPPRVELPRAVDAEHVAGEVLVGFRDNATARERAAARARLGARATRRLGPTIERLVLAPGLTTEQAIARHAGDPAIRFVEPNYVVHADELPDDPFFPEQYGLRNEGQTGGRPGADIDVEAAWRTTTGSHEVLVAVLDTGIDQDHPDLAANMWTNPGEIPDNGVDDDANGFVDDVRGWDFHDDDNDPHDDNNHGTHVAGIIGAAGDNGIGTSGVAWKVRLVAVKFLGSNGAGTLADAIAAIDYAAAIGAKVTNNSWGGAPFSQALRDAIGAAGEAGVLFVASAGNDGRDTDREPYFPAGYDEPNVVSVAMTDHDGYLVQQSNFGATSVDLGAPGLRVLSTLAGGRYGFASGTSMAAPHVAGAAALILSIAPGMGPVDLKRLILDNVEPDPALRRMTATGGHLSVRRMIEARDRVPPAAIDDLTIEQVTSGSIVLRWTAPGDDGDQGTARAYDVRRSTAPLDEGNFADAIRVSPAPAPGPAGSSERFEVSGLEPGRTYFLALEAVDEWNNAGPMSNVVLESTAPPPVFVSEPGAFEISLYAGQSTERTLVLSNAGQGTLDWRMVHPALPPVPGFTDYGAEPERWLGVDRGAGRLLAGERESVRLSIEARGLDSGVHETSVDIETNDPARPLVSHPVTLLVLGAPAIEANPPALDLGLVFAGTSRTVPLEIRNTGTEALRVHGIRVAPAGGASLVPPRARAPRDGLARIAPDVAADRAMLDEEDGTAVRVDPPTLTVPPRGASTVLVSFSPAGPVILDETLIVESDASNAPLLAVPLAGRAQAPPRIAVDPPELHVSSDGAAVRRTLAIANAGASDLVLALSFDDPGKAAPPSVLVNGGFETGDFTGWRVTSNGRSELSPWAVARAGAGWFGDSNPQEGEFDALNGFDGEAGLECDLVQDFVVPADAVRAELSYHERIQFDGLLNPSTQPRLYRATLEDPGGAVLLELAREEVWLNGRPFTDRGWRRRAADLSAFAGRTLRLHVHQRVPETSTGPAMLELDDFHVDLAGFPAWLEVEPTRITVPPGETAALEVVLDPGGAMPGTLEGAIRIETNAPDAPTVWVPVALAVGASPHIVVSGPPVRVESIRAFGSVLASTTHELPVPEPPAGDGMLEVVVEGDFGFDNEFASVLVEGRAMGTVGRSGEDCSGVAAEFPFETTRLGQAAADGVVQVEVRNRVTVAPFCEQNRHRVTLSYRKRPGPIDFGPVPVRARAATTIAIGNRGALPLVVASVGSDAPQFAVSRPALVVAPFGEETVELSFTPDATRAFAGTLVIESDDPDTPRIELPLSGAGGAPAALTVAPSALDATLAVGGREVVALTLSNPGGTPLDYELSVEAAVQDVFSRFEPLGASPTPLSCVAGDPASGRIYGQEREGTAFQRYDAAAEAWVTLAPAPIHSGDGCGATIMGGTVYTSYAEDSRLGVYDIASGAWSTMPAPLGHTANVTGDGRSFLYQVRESTAVRLDTDSLETRVLAPPPFPFDRRGGLRHLDGKLYGHQGHGGTDNVGFASYDVATDGWTVLPVLPGLAVLGAEIDPFGRAYAAYGGPQLFRYAIDSEEWSALDIPFFFAGDGGMAWLADPPALYFVEGRNGRGLARLRWPPPLVRADPPRGTIPPAGSARVEVTLSALDAAPGLHEAEIVIATGDTLTVVPVRVRVEGLPDLAIAGDPMTVESTSDFTQAGATTRHVLRLPGAVEGAAWLELEAEGDFGGVGETATALVEGTSFGPIGNAGSDCAPVRTVFQVEPGVLESLSRDGAIEVDFANRPAVDSFCATNRHRVRLTYSTPATRLDFGRVLRGGVRYLPLTIANHGSAMLHVGEISSDTPRFTPAVAALDVPAGASERVLVGFAPDVVGPFSGTLRVASDDGDTPTLALALSGSGIEAPRIEVTPRALAATLTEGARETIELSVSNSGAGPLELGLVVHPPGRTFATLEPASGLVPAGSSIEILARLDATGLAPGQHAAEIRIESNDPATPLLAVPLTLAVTGAPRLAIHGDPVTIESAERFVRAEQRTEHALPVVERPAGGGTIELIAEGDFNAGHGRSATLIAEGLRLGSVATDRLECGPAAGSFRLSPAALEALIADGTLEVEVQNTAVVNPLVCATNRHVVRLRYDAVLRSLDFGSRFAGIGGDRTVVIENSGTEPLEIRSITSDAAEFVPSPSSMTLPAGASAPLVVAFRPQAASAFSGRLRIESNDPAAGKVEIPLLGVAAEAPFVSVDPDSASLTLARGERTTLELRISNTGAGPLTWMLEVVPQPSPFVAPGASAGVLPPGETALVPVGIDAAGLPLATHRADIEIRSNDPLSPLVTFPVTLTVSGAPEMRLGGQSLSVESRLDYATAGATTAHRLSLPAPPGGSGVVELIADGDFGDEDETVSVLAEGVELGSSGGSGPDCGTYVSSFLVGATTMTALGSDGVVEIELRNSRHVGSFCPANRHAVLLRYRAPLDALDFGGVAVGSTRRLEMLVENAGTDLLRVHSIAAGVPELLASPAAFDLPPGVSRTVGVFFSPSSEGSWATELIVTSNDPRAPVVTVPLRGAGARLPDLVVTGTPIDVALEAGEVTTRSLTLANPGGLPLDFVVTVAPPAPAWLGVDPTSGSVPPGGSAELTVRIDATGLVAGNYAAPLRIASNDPAEPLVELPVSLACAGSPDLALAGSGRLDFGTVFVGRTVELALAVDNRGSEVLEIGSITSDAAAFAPGVSALEIAPGGSASLAVSFTPPAAGVFGGTLRLVSDDPDSPAIDVPLAGNGAEPPILDLDPPALDALVPAGGRAEAVLSVSNRGPSALEYALTATQVAGSPPLPEHAIDFQLESLAPSPVPLTCLIGDPAGGHVYAQARHGRRFFRFSTATGAWDDELAQAPIDSGSGGGAAWLGGRIYTSYGTGSQLGVYDPAEDSWSTIPSPLVGTANIASDGERYLYLVRANFGRRLDPLTGDVAQIAPPPFAFGQWSGLGYSGGRIYGHAGGTSASFAAYDRDSGVWSALAASPGPAALGAAIDALAGRYVALGGTSPRKLYRYALDSASWDELSLPFIAGDRGGVAWLPRPVSAVYLSEDGGTGFARLASEPSFLIVDRRTGVVPPGETVGVRVGFDATGLAAGTWDGAIVVSSNDPTRPNSIVPATLVVGDAAHLVVLGEVVSYESMRSFTGAGATTTHELAAGAAPAGAGTLLVTVAGDFGGPGKRVTVAVEGSVLGLVGGEGQGCTLASAALPVVPADLAAFVRDGVVEIEVRNADAVGSSCGANTHAVSLSYREALDRLDFGNVVAGSARGIGITLGNDGTAPLAVHSVTTDPSEFSAGAWPPALAPGESAMVSLAFRPTHAGAFAGTLSISSNDPGAPALDLPLAGAGVPSPAIVLAPAEIEATLPEGGRTNVTLTVGNAGDGPLELEVVADAFVVADEARLSVPPGGAAELNLSLDASDLEPGVHRATLRLLSNDLALPEAGVPTSLEVTPAPDLALGGEPLFAESSASFGASGARTEHALAVPPGPVGSGNLELTVDGDFGLADETAAVVVEGREVGVLGGVGPDCVPATLQIGLDARMLRRLFADGIVSIDVRNADRVDPVCDVNRHAARLRYHLPVPRIDFGEVIADTTAERELTVFNTGSVQLEVGSIAVAGSAFAVSPGTATVAPGEHATLRVTFTPPVAGPAEALLTLESDDPDRPVVSVPLAGAGIEPARIEVVPRELHVVLSDGDRAAPRLTLRNAGAHPLEFSVRALGAGGEAADLPFLVVEPNAGIVPPGESTGITVWLDSAALAPGEVASRLAIASNDPLEPVALVPLRVTRLGRPDIAVIGPRVEVRSSVDYAEHGARTTHALGLAVRPAGAARLDIVAEGDFGLPSETATLRAEGLSLGAVGGEELDCIPAAGSFYLDPADTARLVADGVVNVEVQNSPDVGLVCSVNRHTLVLSYDAPATRVDFGTVFLGSARARSVVVRNDGEGDLRVVSVVADDPRVAVLLDAFVVPPSAAVEIPLIFTPAGPAPLAATLSIASEDLDEPRITLDLAGQVVGPPAAEIEPEEIRAKLPPGLPLVEHRTLRVRNGGGSDLLWSAAAVDLPPEAAAASAAWTAGEKGDDSDSGAGELSIDRTGGPDGRGYRFRDSDEPGGPVFVWQDVSAGGTPVELDGGDDAVSGPLAIGFAFPFYGGRFDAVHVASDGWLSFTSRRPSYSNPDTLPNAGASVPPDLIAPFWDDLRLHGAARIHVGGDSRRFVVQYSGVDRFASGAELTFQVILYPSGAIVFQYLSMAGRTDSATIGIQNGERDLGLLVAYNETYVHDGLAVELTPVAPWLTLDPPGGVVPPGSAVDIAVEVTAENLPRGAQRAEITLRTNDPARQEPAVPVTLDVDHVRLDRFDFDPETLRPASRSRAARATLQLPPSYDPRDVEVATISLGGVLHANPVPVELADTDGDGVEELIVEFDRQALLRLLPAGARVPVTISGRIAGDDWFAATTEVAVPRRPGARRLSLR